MSVKQRIVNSLGHLGRIIQIWLELFLQSMPLGVHQGNGISLALDVAGHEMELPEEGVDVYLVLGHEALLDLRLARLGICLGEYLLLLYLLVLLCVALRCLVTLRLVISRFGPLCTRRLASGSLGYRCCFSYSRVQVGSVLLALGLLDLLVDVVSRSPELVLQVFKKMLLSLGVLLHDIGGQILPGTAELDQVRHDLVRQVHIRFDLGAIEVVLQQVLEEGVPDVGLVGLEESVVEPIDDWRVFQFCLCFY